MSTLKEQLEQNTAEFNKQIDELVEAAPVIREMVKKVKPLVKELYGTLMECASDNEVFDKLVVTGLAGQLAKAQLSAEYSVHLSTDEIAARSLNVARKIVAGAKE